MVIYSRVTSAPATEPVTVNEAKTHLRVTSTADDTYITTLIKVARQLCEKYAGLSFITQTRQIKLDFFPGCNLPVEIPYGPIISFSGDGLGVSYIDTGGGNQTLTLNTDYKVDSASEPGRIYPIDDWPTDAEDDYPQTITITYTAGYGAAASVPEVIKQAILEEIYFRYERRGDAGGGLSEGAIALLDTVKVYWNAHQN
jgi:uncharacterized phiE125 gp8 family phage protein